MAQTTDYAVTYQVEAGALITKAQLRLSAWPAFESGSEAIVQPWREDHIMPKGQQKSNKEVKKPKKDKTVAAAPPTFAKASSEPSGPAKKKG